MSEEHKPLPVAGYVPQSDAKIALANEGKELEERYLRWLDKLVQNPILDYAMIERARTDIKQGAMWAIRSIFQPTRIKLPEDN